MGNNETDVEAITRAIKNARNTKPDQNLRSSDDVNIKGLHVFDGGDDWQLIEDVTSWICPKGSYEVYFKPSAEVLLNGVNLIWGATTMWCPYFSWQTFSNLTGEIGTPGSGDTILVFDAYISACTLPNGFRLSSGDTLTSTGSFDVRFRRIG